MTRTVRRPTEADHARVMAVLPAWWRDLGGVAGTEERTALLPRLYFQHFTDTSLVIEDDGDLLGFLIGFMSPARTDEAYIHFVGVAPGSQGVGLGRQLYELFFELARLDGRGVVRAITSVANSESQAFHDRMGFVAEPGPRVLAGCSDVHPNYDGPGLDRVSFVRNL